MLFLKVVVVVSKSQYEWVKNGDAPGNTPRNGAVREQAAVVEDCAPPEEAARCRQR